MDGRPAPGPRSRIRTAGRPARPPGRALTVAASGPDAREAAAALIAILSEATKVGG